MRLIRPAAFLCALLASSPASAFCRRTTCDPATGPCPTDEAGCTTKGTPLYWTRPLPLPFRLQARDSALLIREEARAAVRAAFFRWSDVVCANGQPTSLRFAEGPEIINDDAQSASDAFGVYFRDRGWPHVAGPGGDGQLALTTARFATTSGKMIDAIIEINTTTAELTTREGSTGTDLQTVVTHEVGHFIGLDHSLVPNSIMAPSLCASGDRCTRDKVSARRLGDDDRAAVCVLFPPGAAASSDPPPPSGCQVGPPQRGRTVLLSGGLLVLAGLVIVSRRGRRS